MLLDGATRQRHAGVDQRDLAPQNVLLVPAPTTTTGLAQQRGGKEHPPPPPQRAALIVSTVHDLTGHEQQAARASPPGSLTARAPDVLPNTRNSQGWSSGESSGGLLRPAALYEPVLEEPDSHEPPPRGEERLETLAAAPEVARQHGSCPSCGNRGRGRGRGERFEVVRAPEMLEGEEPAATSSPLIDLMRARARALEMGLCEEDSE